MRTLQKGFASLFVIILIVVVGLGGVLYLGYRNAKNTITTGGLITSTPTDSPTDTTAVSVSITASPSAASDSVERKALTSYLTDVYYDQGKKYGKTKDKVYIKIVRFDGEFANGTGGFADGGGDVWWAVKMDGEWKIVAQGHEPPPCSVREQYNFPESIFGGCNK